MKLSIGRIAEITGAQADKLDPNAIAIGYSIDSRTIRPAELFFAVKGEKMDGHDFVAQAIEKGAAGAVVGRERLSSAEWRARMTAAQQSKLLAVEDTLEALQLIAKSVRNLWARPLIAVTRSEEHT